MLNKKMDAVVAPTAEPRSPIQQNPNKLSGAPTISDYRVHAETLIDYFAEGLTLNDFLEDFEGTPKEDTLAVLSVIRQAIRDGLLTGITVRDENVYQLEK